MALMGDRILEALGIAQMPPFLAKIQENKLGVCMMLWVMGGTFSQTLMKTGAFEVYFDGHLVNFLISSLHHIVTVIQLVS